MDDLEEALKRHGHQKKNCLQRSHKQHRSSPTPPIGNTSGLVIPDTAPSLHGATAPAIKPVAQEKSWWQRWGSDVVHTGLDVVGLIPGVGEIADGANALIYLAEGPLCQDSCRLSFPLQSRRHHRAQDEADPLHP